VGFVRSGDPPAGNAAAADQPAAATKVTGDLEDLGADEPAATVQSAAAATGAGEPESAPDRDEAAAGDRSDEDRDGLREPGGADEPGPEARSAAPQPSRSWAGLAARLWARTVLSVRSQTGGQREDRPRQDRQRQDRQRQDRPPRYPDAAAAGFARLTVLPAILIMAWLLIGLPLLLAGVFSPTPTLLVALLLAILLSMGMRRMPIRWPRALPGDARAAEAKPRPERGWPAWWGLVGTVVVAVGFAVWQLLFNSESVIVLRDPGAYLQTGYWIAQHGSLPIPQSLAAFGGVHPGLAFSSTGFSAHGTSVVPGLMSGLPLLLAAAFWVHGIPAAAAMGPLLGGLAVLAFGGLVGRLAGPRWAPAGALVLACTLPEQYTSRASFSEAAAQVLLFGGLSLVVDALTLGRARTEAARTEAGSSAVAGGAAGRMPSWAGRVPSWAGRMPSWAGRMPSWAGGWRKWFGALAPGPDRAPEWALMALGGLALGLTSLLRFDGLLDVLPAIPFVGILVIQRSKSAVPFCIGLAIGAAYGLADGYLLARPFVESLRPMPELIGLIAVWLLVMTVAGVELLRLPGFRYGLRSVLARRPVRLLPDLCGILAVAAIVGLAIRPYLQTVRGPATGATASFVASLQRLEHLPVDPGRLYAEDTLYWVIWYVGLPAVLLGGVGLALLVRRCVRALLSRRDPSGAARVWALPLAVICCGSAAVLWQPETVPDQPWASRRLVPLVLPGLILCAIWASAWLRGRGQSRGAGRTAASVVAAFCVAALLVPTLATTFGLTLTHSGKSGALRPTADGLALKRTGPGEVGAVTRLCSLLGPSASVVIVAQPVAQQFTQVIRGMCGDPAASMAGQPISSVLSVLASIEHAGRRPVLLGARPSQLYAFGGSPVRVLDLSTSQDPHTLTQPPTTLSPADYVIWMSSISPVGTRA
jgi:hypothetical protein